MEKGLRKVKRLCRRHFFPRGLLKGFTKCFSQGFFANGKKGFFISIDAELPRGKA
jgi:hypothetical protein